MQSRNDYVISCGATGSKLFAKFLYPEYRDGQAAQHHMHTRDPAKVPRDGRNFIYLFGDPRNAILSFFARRHKRHDRHNFFGHLVSETDRNRPAPDWVVKHLTNLGCDPSGVSVEWGLNAYLKNAPQDVFQMEAHFDNWARATDRPVLFVRYETLWKYEPELKALLDCGTSSLPAPKPRAANWRGEPTGIRSGLNNLVGPFADRLAALPDIFGQYGAHHIQSPQDVSMRQSNIA